MYSLLNSYLTIGLKLGKTFNQSGVFKIEATADYIVKLVMASGKPNFVLFALNSNKDLASKIAR